MKSRFLISILLAAGFSTLCSRSAFAQSRPAENEVVVFNNGTSDIPYRIPAITQTRRGKLLAACDFRINRADVGWNHRNGLYQVNVVMKSSEDHGRSWSDSVCVARGDEHATEVRRIAYGDPSLVADRTSNEVLLHCVAGNMGYQRATRDNPQHAVFFHSKNGGKTWDDGTDLTEMIHGLYDGKLPGSGHADGIFLTSGRIMQSRYVRVGKYYRLYIAHPVRQRGLERCGTYVIYSDDFGRSWQVLGGAGPEAPSTAQDESKVEELPNGDVLLSCREMYGGRKFNVFTYTDAAKGEGQWGREVMPDNMTAREVNACNGEILIVPARGVSSKSKVHLALQSVPLSSKRDSVGFFYRVIPEGANMSDTQFWKQGWEKGLRLTDGSSCYSTMVLMDNRKIGFLYERNGYKDGYDIVYQSLTVEEITKGAFKLR
ncbi:sialidase family protein [Prevotella sp.]|uniref:sialidase family protein n=1 Tax=Prevotella sp. TaxID=59823 RepID=UPI002F925391